MMCLIASSVRGVRRLVCWRVGFARRVVLLKMSRFRIGLACWMKVLMAVPLLRAGIVGVPGLRVVGLG